MRRYTNDEISVGNYAKLTSEMSLFEFAPPSVRKAPSSLYDASHKRHVLSQYATGKSSTAISEPRKSASIALQG